jgi:hypothetical protein
MRRRRRRRRRRRKKKKTNMPDKVHTLSVVTKNASP